jgi:site-specific DNA recombinase
MTKPSPPEPVRTALYVRVSTAEQAEKYGLTSQLTELRALAARKGYDVRDGAEFVDDDASGATLDRPALAKLRDAVRVGAFDLVLVHDPDRLSRRLAHQLLLLEEFQVHGAQVEFLTTPSEDTPEGRLLLNVRGVIAEYERTKIIERTLRGRREKARRGLIPGGTPPFGYRMDPANSGRWVIKDDEADVVRLIFRMVTEEQRSIRQVTVELRRLGLRPQRAAAWERASVQAILRNEAYAGRAHFRSGGEDILITVPALTTPETFEQARAQLVRNRVVMPGRPSAHFWLLKGLVRCGLCGRRYLGDPSHGRRYYRCGWHDVYSNRCGARALRAPEAETFIWDTLVGVLRHPALLASKLDEHKAQLGTRQVEVRSEAEQLARQLADVQRQEQRALDLYLADGRLEVPGLRDRLEELARRRKGVQERLAQAQQRALVAEAQEAHQTAVARFCALALRGLGKLTPDGRQRLLRALIDEIIVRDGAFEIHGVLPGRWVPGAPGENCPGSRPVSCTRARSSSRPSWNRPPRSSCCTTTRAVLCVPPDYAELMPSCSIPRGGAD